MGKNQVASRKHIQSLLDLASMDRGSAVEQFAQLGFEEQLRLVKQVKGAKQKEVLFLAKDCTSLARQLPATDVLAIIKSDAVSDPTLFVEMATPNQLNTILDLDCPDEFIYNFINRLCAMDHELFTEICLQLAYEDHLPGTDQASNAELGAFNARNERLGKAGIPTLGKSRQVYERFKLTDIALPNPQGESQALVWRNDHRPFLLKVISAMESNQDGSQKDTVDLAEEIQSLAKKVAVADGTDLSERHLKKVIQKTNIFTSIGLEYASRCDVQTGIRMLREKALEELFRIGFSVLSELKDKAKSILTDPRLQSEFGDPTCFDARSANILRSASEDVPEMRGLDGEYRNITCLQEAIETARELEKLDLLVRITCESLPLSYDRIMSMDEKLRIPSEPMLISLQMILIANVENSLMGRRPNRFALPTVPEKRNLARRFCDGNALKPEGILHCHACLESLLVQKGFVQNEIVLANRFLDTALSDWEKDLTFLRNTKTTRERNAFDFLNTLARKVEGK